MIGPVCWVPFVCGAAVSLILTRPCLAPSPVPLSVGYDSPFRLFDRHNEIWFEATATQAQAALAAKALAESVFQATKAMLPEEPELAAAHAAAMAKGARMAAPAARARQQGA